MATTSTTAAGPVAAAAASLSRGQGIYVRVGGRRRVGCCQASSFQSSPQRRASVSLQFPPRIGPLFWPWEKVKIGSLSVSPMGFGTWSWGNQLLWGYQEEMDGELQEIFNLAVKNGINLFDTADSYGTGRLNGKSEILLGKFIREFPGSKVDRENIVIATKFAAYPWRLTSGQFVKACESSLERLEIDQIGIGQLHWSTSNYAPFQEYALWDGLVSMYEKGLVCAVGVSNYGAKQLVKIHDYLNSRGVPLVSAQSTWTWNAHRKVHSFKSSSWSTGLSV